MNKGLLIVAVILFIFVVVGLVIYFVYKRSAPESTNTTDNITNTTDNITNTTDNITNTTDNITNTTDNITNTTDNITNTTVEGNSEKNISNKSETIKKSNSEKSKSTKIEKGDIGYNCKLNIDCKNYGPGPTDVACCKGKCTKKKTNWEGVGYCPNVCQDAPSPLGKPGTCGNESWPRKIGESCDTNLACEGHTRTGTSKILCCNGKCNQLVADWRGVPICPYKCYGAPSRLVGPGTCVGKKKEYWKRKLNTSCKYNTDCEGYGVGKTDITCCKGKCIQKIKGRKIC
jgi:hypothetical protein